MLSIELVFSALFGLVFGSFLNVCIVRLPQDESVIRPRSRCFDCGKPIRAIDNLPVLSWAVLRGRSRCCDEPIPLRYPLVELATAGLFITSLMMFGDSTEAVGMSVFCWLLLGLAWMDAETYLLPDALTLPGLALGLAYRVLVGMAAGTGAWPAIVQGVVAAAVIGGTLLAISLIYKLIRRREGMGLGDVKLGAMLGAWLGWRLAGVALFVAVLLGAIAGMGWLISRRMRPEKQQAASEPLRLPFGSFLAGAGIFSVFAGKWLLAWYLHFFA